MLRPGKEYYFNDPKHNFKYMGRYEGNIKNIINNRYDVFFLNPYTNTRVTLYISFIDIERRQQGHKPFYTVDETVEYMKENRQHYQADEIIRRHCEPIRLISNQEKRSILWGVDTFIVDEYPPTQTFKVIFNEEKGKTTLLIGEAPYDDESEVFVAKLNREAGRPFNHKLGFTIAFLKYIIQEEQPGLQYYDYDEYMEFMDFITKGDFDRQLDIIVTDILRYLDTELHFSKRQIAKFCETTFDKPLIIKTPYVEYVFEFEFRGEKPKTVNKK